MSLQLQPPLHVVVETVAGRLYCTIEKKYSVKFNTIGSAAKKYTEIYTTTTTTTIIAAAAAATTNKHLEQTNKQAITGLLCTDFFSFYFILFMIFLWGRVEWGRIIILISCFSDIKND